MTNLHELLKQQTEGGTAAQIGQRLGTDQQ